MIFQFEHLHLWGAESENTFNVKNYKKVLTKWQKALEGKGWNALYIENHDIPRVISTWGNEEEYLRECATAFGLMYFMQQGTPFIYQGQEIGMTNVKFDSIYDYNDVKGINIYKEKIEQGLSKEEALKYVWAVSRDNSRTPMQWDNSNNAGFTDGTPWINVNDNYKTINVNNQINDENSILNFYKNMIRIRKENETLVYGSYDLILDEDDKIYAYIRTMGDEKFIVIVNLSHDEVKYSYEEKLNYSKLLLSNYKVEVHDIINEFILKPYEARLYKL